MPLVQSQIEDIKAEQEKEAERSIRLHFQMEQIVYCQDQVYRGALQSVREQEAEEDKSRKSGPKSPGSAEDSSVAEIFQHLSAYSKVRVPGSLSWGPVVPFPPFPEPLCRTSPVRRPSACSTFHPRGASLEQLNLRWAEPIVA